MNFTNQIILNIIYVLRRKVNLIIVEHRLLIQNGIIESLYLLSTPQRIRKIPVS